MDSPLIFVSYFLVPITVDISIHPLLSFGFYYLQLQTISLILHSPGSRGSHITAHLFAIHSLLAPFPSSSFPSRLYNHYTSITFPERK